MLVDLRRCGCRNLGSVQNTADHRDDDGNDADDSPELNWLLMTISTLKRTFEIVTKMCCEWCRQYFLEPLSIFAQFKNQQFQILELQQKGRNQGVTEWKSNIYQNPVPVAIISSALKFTSIVLSTYCQCKYLHIYCQYLHIYLLSVCTGLLETIRQSCGRPAPAVIQWAQKTHRAYLCLYLNLIHSGVYNPSGGGGHYSLETGHTAPILIWVMFVWRRPRPMVSPRQTLQETMSRTPQLHAEMGK